MSSSNRGFMKCYDVYGREVQMTAEDREATARLGREANSLFKAEAERKFAPVIAKFKREAAKKEIDKIREYSTYIEIGTGLVGALSASSFGWPASFITGLISAFAMHAALPTILDKLEEASAEHVQVETELAVKVYR